MRCRELSVDNMEKSMQILGWNASCLDDDVNHQCYLEIRMRCLGLAKHKLLVCSLMKNKVGFLFYKSKYKKTFSGNSLVRSHLGYDTNVKVYLVHLLLK